MPDSQRDDVAWQTAVDWIIRKHESPLDFVAERDLSDWLAKDPANRAAYEEASQLWMLTGLVSRSRDPESGS